MSRIKNLPKVYLETSFISYLASRLSTNLLIAARQMVSRKWWSQKRHFYRLLVSPLVFEETDKGDERLVNFRKGILSEAEILPFVNEVIGLARFFIDQKVVPAKATADAMHIAFAAIGNVDYLLTWNCKHIANAVIQKKLQDLCREKGFEKPVICTPEELMEGKE